MSDSTQSIADYLAQLLKDKKQIAAFPNVFLHVERLLDEGESSAPSTCAASTVPRVAEPTYKLFTTRGV